MTVASIAGPLGFLAAGQVISRVSIYTVILVIAASLTLVSVLFATVLLRNRAAPDLVAMPDVAHG
jgi:hypothetical protein